MRIRSGRATLTSPQAGGLCSRSAKFPRKSASLHLTFSPDGTRLATTEWAIPGGATPVTIWDVDTGKRLAQYPGHRDPAADLLFAADGRSLAIAAGPTIRRWFLEGGAEHPKLAGHTDEAWALALAPDGELLASGSDDDDSETIKLWDPKSGGLIRGWHGGQGTTASLAFSPDGRVLASAHLDEESRQRPPLGRRYRQAARHAQGTYRACPYAGLPSSRQAARVGRVGQDDSYLGRRRAKLPCALNGHENDDPATGHRTRWQTCWPPRPAMVPCALWDLACRAESRVRWRGPEKFTSVEFSPDGRTLAGADEDGSITLWDAATGAQRKLAPR